MLRMILPREVVYILFNLKTVECFVEYSIASYIAKAVKNRIFLTIVVWDLFLVLNNKII